VESPASFSSTLALAVWLAVPVGAQDVVVADLRAPSDAPSVNLLDLPANLTVHEVDLPLALNALHEKSGVRVAFSPSLIARFAVSCDCADVSVRVALDEILAGTNLQYTTVGQQVLVEPAPKLTRPRHDLRVRFASPDPVRAHPAVPAGLESTINGEAPELQEGTITGLVVARGGGGPLSAVQVLIPDIARGVLTDASGRYTLRGVPAGSYRLRAERIGYAAMEVAVDVVSGQTAVANFELMRQALALDEMVVTGTAGGAQRRAVGNVVDRISAEQQLELTPVADIQQLMAFKSPGFSVLPAQGEVGAGGSMRIRGGSTIGLSSEPIVYIDGIRMNNELSGPGGTQGRNLSRLSDINPDDIESIEIIKGPAAATLYGTEASSGVIQIITKRGVEGAPRFDFSVGQGANWFANPAGRLGEVYGLDGSGELISVNLYRHEEQHGLGPIFRTGHVQNYSGSVTGGTGMVQYFASASWDDQEGYDPINWRKALATRINLSVLPRDNFTLSFHSSYMRSTVQKAQGFPDDLLRQVLWGTPTTLDSRLRGFLRRTPEAIREDTENISKVNRVLAGVRVDHMTTSWLTQRLNLGIDVTSEDNHGLVRRHPEGASWFFAGNSLGAKNAEVRRFEIFSLDYSGTAEFDLTDDISTATSLGAQYFRRSLNHQTLTGRIFPAPGFETIGSMAVTSSGEDYVENVTVGTYVQQQFGWQDRVFVTGAIRADDNSAFGADFNAALYPKFSATWVVHEESFWNPDRISQLRLRGAWGAAGRQPDIFDAPRLYDAVTGPGDQAGLSPSAFGNPDLKPERAQELEVGFDAGFLSDRVALEYTYYTKTTRDAIVHAPLPPSVGFPGSQVLNIGQLSNWGHEIGLTARLVERPRFSWETGLQYSILRDRVDDLGGLDAVTTDSRGGAQHRVGYPLDSFFWWRIISADLAPDGTTSNEMCDGGTGSDGLSPGGAPVPCDVAPRVYWGRSTNPTSEGGIWTTVTMGNLRLHARADGRGGPMFSSHAAINHTAFQNSSMSNLQDNAIFQAYRKIGREPLGFEKSGFVRLRDVSVTYTVPPEWAGRIRGSRASITVSGRNLALLWREQKYVEVPGMGRIPDPANLDPEMRPAQEAGGFIQAFSPPLQSIITTIRVSF
jgi:TonB-dependent starch-binding outer membrane protein SusC